MDELLTRFLHDLIERRHGPFGFRFILQPLVAVYLAIRDGIVDARKHNHPYFWALFTHTGQRMALIKNGWKSVAKVFVLAIALDLVYQIIEFRAFRPMEMLVVAFCLAIVPYILLRGPANRIARTIFKN
ncbi:MAG TPA: hypothetical protein VHV83_06410 [Armatimonadota bacterium]|nr:hypothetical protein [Armatimonadota bacterium]